jgi:hypothetical protein
MYRSATARPGRRSLLTIYLSVLMSEKESSDFGGGSLRGADWKAPRNVRRLHCDAFGCGSEQDDARVARLLDKLADHMIRKALAGKPESVIAEARRRLEAGETVTVDAIETTFQATD